MVTDCGGLCQNVWVTDVFITGRWPLEAPLNLKSQLKTDLHRPLAELGFISWGPPTFGWANVYGKDIPVINFQVILMGKKCSEKIWEETACLKRIWTRILELGRDFNVVLILVSGMYRRGRGGDKKGMDAPFVNFGGCCEHKIIVHLGNGV
ncbi:hypothetical protein AVEN_230241-1 [Araneus ventricosus]|uniref:Uncharacterized protein n=1 Tax=Araneus ventricosus TaxID=182803 RepID=A0A4Y2DYH1_ARAVE|nr:hypothetical protein AVEN_230241-1 [Araneus ventricosus]